MIFHKKRFCSSDPLSHMKILLANIRIYGEPSAAHTHQEAPNRLAVASGGGDRCEPQNH